MKPEVKKKLQDIYKLRKEQLKLVDKSSEPIRDNMRMLKDVLDGQANVKQYVSQSESLDRYLKSVFSEEFRKSETEEMKN